MSELPPPPAPRPVQMPAMSEADRQRLNVAPSSSPAAGQPMAAPMMGAPMMGTPMMGTPMMGGCPSVGMGPNLVFNFGGGYPGMCMVAPPPPPPAAESAPEKPPGPPEYVQGDPTWCRPRMPVTKGQKMKADPCVIM